MTLPTFLASLAGHTVRNVIDNAYVPAIDMFVAEAEALLLEQWAGVDTIDVAMAQVMRFWRGLPHSNPAHMGEQNRAILGSGIFTTIEDMGEPQPTHLLP